MADYVLEKKSDLTAIADAIREKSGLTEGITVAEMAALISAIESGGGELTIGGHKVLIGQVTPTETVTGDLTLGSGTYPVAFTSILFRAFWLNDPSVVPNYSAGTILLGVFKIGQLYNCLYYNGSGEQKVDVKSSFGWSSSRLKIETHANWPIQPETYNYMVIYDE